MVIWNDELPPKLREKIGSPETKMAKRPVQLDLLRLIALMLLLAATFNGDQGHIIAAGLTFTGLCCLR